MSGGGSADAGLSSGSSGTGGSGDAFNDALGSALSSGFDDASTGDTNGGAEPDATGGAEGADQISDNQPPLEADEVNEQTDGQAPTADGNAEPLPGWKLNEDGTYNVSAAELPRVQSALQYADAVSQYFNTPQEAQNAASTASQMRQLQNDWNYGSADSVRGVLDFLVGNTHTDPNGRAAFQRSFGQMMSMAPDYLQRSNPQAYSSLVQSFTNRIIESRYQHAASVAAQFPNSDSAKQAMIDAQAVEYGITGGTYRTELPKVDSQAQARTQFEQQRADFQRQQDAAFQRDLTVWNTSSLDGAETQQLNAAIDAKLATVKDKFPETAFADMREGIRREVIAELKKATDWFTEHTQSRDALIRQYQQTWRSNSPLDGLKPLLNSHVADFMLRANRVLTPIAQKRITAATQARVAAVNGRGRNANGQFQTGSPTAPASANRPNPTNGANNGRNGNTPRQPNQSRSDQFDAALASAFAQFRR